MFDTITEDELGMLRSKLYSAGHKFSNRAHELGAEALALPVLGAAHEAKWAERAPFVDAMTEAYDLAEESETGPETLLGTNPYEAACERFDHIVRTRPKIIADARAKIAAAEQEWEDAQANLRQYESAPGIPLPQYRRRMPWDISATEATRPGPWDFTKAAMSVQIND
jgi:hypothetical protein